MTSVKYIGMDVHTESTSIAVRNSIGKIVMECVIETKASTLLQFLDGLRGDVRVVFEEGTWATWLYDLLKPHVTEVLVCNTRKNAVRKGSKSDRIDARKLAEQLYMNNVKSVYHGEHGLRMMKELARSYLTITKDLVRVMNRLKALYRSWGIPCAGTEVYALRYRAEWLANTGLTSTFVTSSRNRASQEPDSHRQEMVPRDETDSSPEALKLLVVVSNSWRRNLPPY